MVKSRKEKLIPLSCFIRTLILGLGSMAQGAEHLLREHKALSSNSSAAKERSLILSMRSPCDLITP
jgi:hypothetical protein